MNGITKPLGVGALFSRSAALVRGNLELFLLLAALWAVINTAMSWPLQRKMAAFQSEMQGATDPQVVWSALADILPWLLVLFVFGLILFGIFTVIWVRAIARGRNAVFATGFVRRVLDVSARYLALVGYFLLLVVAALIAVFLFKAVTGLSGALLGEGTGRVVGLVLSTLLILALLVAIFTLMSGFMIAAAGAALECRLSLSITMQELLRHRRRFIVALVLLILFAAVAVLVIGFAFGAKPDAPQSLWHSLAGGFVGSGINLLALAMGVVALETPADAAGEAGQD